MAARNKQAARVESLRRYFKTLPDPRSRLGRRHRLDEMVIIAIWAVICAMDNRQEVAQFAQAKRKWLKTFLELPHLIRDTLKNLRKARLQRKVQ